MDNLAPKPHGLVIENLDNSYHLNNHIFSSRIGHNFKIASVLYPSEMYILCFMLPHLLFFIVDLRKSDY